MSAEDKVIALLMSALLVISFPVYAIAAFMGMFKS